MFHVDDLKNVRGVWTRVLCVAFKTGQLDFFTTAVASWSQRKAISPLLVKDSFSSVTGTGHIVTS